ncbi:MAG: PKD domain-containing protein, partial [Thermoplasmatota archaeon]
MDCDNEGESWGIAFDAAGSVESGWVLSGAPAGSSPYSGAVGTTTGPGSGLTPVSFTQNATDAVSVSRLGPVEIVQHYRPVPGVPDAYEDAITLYTGHDAVGNLSFRRHTSWKDPRGPGDGANEALGIVPGRTLPTAVTASNTLPSADPDPTGPTHLYCPTLPTWTPYYCRGLVDGPPTTPYATGVADVGTMYQFNFGPLRPGAPRLFSLYYGGGANTTRAIQDIQATHSSVFAMVWTYGLVSHPYKYWQQGNFTCTVPPTGQTTCPYQYNNQTYQGPLNSSCTQNGWNYGTYPEPGTNYTALFTSFGGDLSRNLDRPPVAIITGPDCGSGVLRFSSASSFDPDKGDSIVAWHWDFGDGSNSEDPNPSHAFPSAGHYVVTLNITEATGLQASASRVVTYDCPPVLAPIPDQVVRLGSAMAYQCFLASDPDDALQSLTWNIDPIPPGVVITPSHCMFWTPPEIGYYKITVEVCDRHACASQDFWVDVWAPPVPGAPPPCR